MKPEQSKKFKITKLIRNTNHRKIEVEIPANQVTIKSLNNFLYSHWSKYRKYKQDWGWCLKSALQKANAEKRFYDIVQIHTFRTDQMDEDNLKAGCKPILDLLKEFGYIEDDSPDKIKVHYLQSKVTSNNLKGTLIALW